MAYRLYLTNSAADVSPAGSSGNWDDTAGAVVRALSTTKSGSATSVGVSENHKNAWAVLLGRWVSAPVVAAGALTGAMASAVAGKKSASGATESPRLVVYVVSGDGGTVRGEAVDVTGSAWATSQAGRTISSGALSSVACQEGDRIVVEYGYASDEGNSSTSYTGTMYYGGTDATDLTNGDTNTAHPPWVEFDDSVAALFTASGGGDDGTYVPGEVKFRSISVGIAASGGTTTTVTCPADVEPGDLLLFYAVNDAPSFYGATTGGITLLDPSPTPSDTAVDVGTGSWFRIATSDDTPGSTTYSVTKLNTSTTQPLMLICVAYSGINPDAWPPASSKHAYLQGSTSSTVSANSPCPTPTSPTSIAAEDLVVRVYAFGVDAAGTGITTTGPPAGWTQRGAGQTVTNVSGKYNVVAIICDRVGGTDTPTISANKTGSWDIYTIAIPAELIYLRNPSEFLPFFGL